MNSGVIITSATKPSPSGKRFILFNIGGADGVIRCYRWERKKGYDTLHTSTEVGWMLIASSGNGENVGLSLANVLQGARTAISVVEFLLWQKRTWEGSHNMTPHLVTGERQHGYDDVHGTVIGGNYVAWCVAYDGRPAVAKDYAANDDEAIEKGKALIAQLKAEWCGEPCHLYPDASKWTVRIYE